MVMEARLLVARAGVWGLGARGGPRAAGGGLWGSRPLTVECLRACVRIHNTMAKKVRGLYDN